jgi:hypothetical protein
MASNRKELRAEIRANRTKGIDARRWISWTEDSAGHAVEFILRKRFPLASIDMNLSMTQRHTSEDSKRLLLFMSGRAQELRVAMATAARLFRNRHVATGAEKLARQGLWDLQQARHAWLTGSAREAALLADAAARRLNEIRRCFEQGFARLGVEYGQQQSDRAKLPRSGEIGEIVGWLAGQRDELGDPAPARDLWPLLYSQLEQRGFDPEEVGDDSYEYDAKAGRKTYNFRAFQVDLSRARKKKTA